MTTTIAAERPDTPDAVALIVELEADLDPLYPAASRHGYGVEKLIREGVSFFVLREDGVPIGCGGIQLYGDEYGELKRMYVRPQHRGAGHARRLLDHLAAYARERGVLLLRLETGIHQHAAIALYERKGFRRVPPFGAYRPDPLSLFYEKRLRGFKPDGWPTVTPRIIARDAPGLVEFVKRVFGATGDYRASGRVELRIGDSVVMVSDAGARNIATALLYVYVEDADATYEAATAAGARTIEAPLDTPYGDRRATVEDRWGNTWQIATRLTGRSVPP